MNRKRRKRAGKQTVVFCGLVVAVGNVCPCLGFTQSRALPPPRKPLSSSADHTSPSAAFANGGRMKNPPPALSSLTDKRKGEKAEALSAANCLMKASPLPHWDDALSRGISAGENSMGGMVGSGGGGIRGMGRMSPVHEKSLSSSSHTARPSTRYKGGAACPPDGVEGVDGGARMFEGLGSSSSGSSSNIQSNGGTNGGTVSNDRVNKQRTSPSMSSANIQQAPPMPLPRERVTGGGTGGSVSSAIIFVGRNRPRQEQMSTASAGAGTGSFYFEETASAADVIVKERVYDVRDRQDVIVDGVSAANEEDASNQKVLTAVAPPPPPPPPLAAPPQIPVSEALPQATTNALDAISVWRGKLSVYLLEAGATHFQAASVSATLEALALSYMPSSSSSYSSSSSSLSVPGLNSQSARLSPPPRRQYRRRVSYLQQSGTTGVAASEKKFDVGASLEHQEKEELGAGGSNNVVWNFFDNQAVFGGVVEGVAARGGQEGMVDDADDDDCDDDEVVLIGGGGVAAQQGRSLCGERDSLMGTWELWESNLSAFVNEGFTGGDLAIMLVAEPNLLWINFETVIQPCMDLLREKLALRPTDLRRIVRRAPAVVSTYAGDGCGKEFQALFQVLELLGLRGRNLKAGVLTWPRLLTFSASRYFQLAAWLSSDEVGIKASDVGQLLRHAPMLVEGDIDENMKAIVDYFVDEVGVEDLSRMLRAYPQLLLCDLETELMPKVSFLNDEVKIDEEDLPKVLQTFPLLLAVRLERMRAVLDFLRFDLELDPFASRTAFSSPAVVVTLSSSPSSPVSRAGGGSGRKLSPNADDYVDDNATNTVKPTAVVVSPELAFASSKNSKSGKSGETTEKVLLNVKSGAGVDDNLTKGRIPVTAAAPAPAPAAYSSQAVSKILRAFPSLLGLDVNKHMIKVVAFLKRIGVVNVGRFVSRLPPVLGYDVDDNLQPKVQWLIRDMGLSVYDILSFPAYFSYPLPTIIEPRTLFLQLRKRPMTVVGLNSALTGSDADFAKKIAKVQPELYLTFKKAYLQSRADVAEGRVQVKELLGDFADSIALGAVGVSGVAMVPGAAKANTTTVVTTLASTGGGDVKVARGEDEEKKALGTE